MIRADVYNTSGKLTGKVALPEDYFAAKPNLALLTQATRVYLANQRKARAKTQSRSEVSLTKAKAYRQKGTGRARHGARSAPIFVGGGVAHGPRGNQNWQITLPQKMRKQALASALASKLANKELVVIEGLEKISGKTKELVGVLNLLFYPKSRGKKKQKFLLVLDKKEEKVTAAAKNLPNLHLNLASSLNAYEVLNGGKILFTIEGVKSLKKNEK